MDRNQAVKDVTEIVLDQIGSVGASESVATAVIDALFPEPQEARHVALTEFRGLGYTDQQAHDLVGAARQLAAASGLTQDDAERALFRALSEFHPAAYRPTAVGTTRSGRWL